MTSCPHVSVVLDLLSLFYLFSIINIPQVRFSSAAVISYNNSRLKAVFVNVLILFTIFFFVKLYHAGTVCARCCARLLVCFGRPVGWKQTVKLRLIKLMRLMCSNDGHYA